MRGSVQTLARTAARAEAAGFDAVWSPEFYTRSAVVSLAAMAVATSSCRVGSSIAYASGRSPMVLATEARSLDELTGGRLVLGLGTGTRRMMEDWHGIDGASPAPRMEELIPLLRALWRLHEQPVAHDGRFYRTHLTPDGRGAAAGPRGDPRLHGGRQPAHDPGRRPRRRRPARAPAVHRAATSTRSCGRRSTRAAAAASARTRRWSWSGW